MAVPQKYSGTQSLFNDISGGIKSSLKKSRIVSVRQASAGLMRLWSVIIMAGDSLYVASGIKNTL